jgi:hypothetical protein
VSSEFQHWPISIFLDLVITKEKGMYQVEVGGLPSLKIEPKKYKQEAIDEAARKAQNLISLALYSGCLDSPTVTCLICQKLVPAITAHRYQEAYVGDACCWDDRLKASE